MDFVPATNGVHGAETATVTLTPQRVIDETRARDAAAPALTEQAVLQYLSALDTDTLRELLRQRRETETAEDAPIVRYLFLSKLSDEQLELLNDKKIIRLTAWINNPDAASRRIDLAECSAEFLEKMLDCRTPDGEHVWTGRERRAIQRWRTGAKVRARVAEPVADAVRSLESVLQYAQHRPRAIELRVMIEPDGTVTATPKNW